MELKEISQYGRNKRQNGQLQRLVIQHAKLDFSAKYN